MKNIKLILLILFAFILIPVVNAEECDEEAINQMREEIAKSDYSLKLEYNEKEKSLYAKIVDLPEGYSAYYLEGEETQLISTDEGYKVGSGIQTIYFLNDTCGAVVYSSNIKIPYYDSSKKDVFADGSIIEESKTTVNIKRILLIIGLTIVIIGLGVIGFIMIKGRLKHEK